MVIIMLPTVGGSSMLVDKICVEGRSKVERDGRAGSMVSGVVSWKLEDYSTVQYAGYRVRGMGTEWVGVNEVRARSGLHVLYAYIVPLL